jgi:hypothetical protein
VEVVTFCNANSSRPGQVQAGAHSPQLKLLDSAFWRIGSLDPSPHRVQEALSHTLALPPWKRFEGLVICWNFLTMQITRRCKWRFDEAVPASRHIAKVSTALRGNAVIVRYMRWCCMTSPKRPVVTFLRTTSTETTRYA